MSSTTNKTVDGIGNTEAGDDHIGDRRHQPIQHVVETKTPFPRQLADLVRKRPHIAVADKCEQPSAAPSSIVIRIVYLHDERVSTPT